MIILPAITTTVAMLSLISKNIVITIDKKLAIDPANTAIVSTETTIAVLDINTTVVVLTWRDFSLTIFHSRNVRVKQQELVEFQ